MRGNPCVLFAGSIADAEFSLRTERALQAAGIHTEAALLELCGRFHLAEKPLWKMRGLVARSIAEICAWLVWRIQSEADSHLEARVEALNILDMAASRLAALANEIRPKRGAERLKELTP